MIARRAAVALGAAVLLAGCTLPGPGDLPWQAGKRALTPEQVLSRAKPTMVLVQVDYSAKISLPEPDVASAALATIRSKLQAQYDSGAHPELVNHDRYVEAFDNELYGNPDKYFSPGKKVFSEEGEALEINGSGFVVSENGFIATSAHVVATKDEEIRKQISDGALKSIKTGAAAALLGDQNRTDEQKQKFTAFFERYSAQYLKIENQRKEIHVGLAKATPGKPLQANGMPATVAAAGDPIPGKDVAVLKVDPGSNRLPSLALGDEKSLRQDTDIIAIGYPGESIFKNQDTDPRQVEPSLSHGGFEAGGVKQTGYDALASKVTISEGESGGPMLDTQGRVVGVIAFGIADEQGKIKPNAGFAVPASVLKEYIDQGKASASESQTEVEYTQALREYEQKHYKLALPLFRDVKERWKDNPYVDAYIADSEKGIVDKADKTPPSLGELAAWGGGGTLAILLLALIAFYLLRRRREHQRVLAALAAVQASAALGGATPPDEVVEAVVPTPPPALRRAAVKKPAVTAAPKAPARPAVTRAAAAKPAATRAAAAKPAAVKAPPAKAPKAAKRAATAKPPAPVKPAAVAPRKPRPKAR